MTTNISIENHVLTTEDSMFGRTVRVLLLQGVAFEINLAILLMLVDRLRVNLHRDKFL